MRFVAKTSYGPLWPSAQKWVERFESDDGLHTLARNIAEWKRDSVLPSEIYDLPQQPLGIQLEENGAHDTRLESIFHDPLAQ